MKNLIQLIASLASVLILFVGVMPVQAETSKYGGWLKIITESQPKVFGYPSQAGHRDHYYMQGCLEHLLDFDKDGQTIPKLVTSWDISSDKKSITLHLRENVKFHDGTDFNAQAVKINLDIVRENSKNYLKEVSSIDVVDTHTVVLNISEYSESIFNTLASRPGYMISPTALENNSAEWAKTHPVGTGPFKFVKYERGVSMEFVKFDDYWDEGKPYLDGMKTFIIADKMAQLAAFRTGNGNMLRLVQPKDAAGLKEEGYEISANPGIVKGLAGDSKNPSSPYAKKKVREALEYAIDKEAIVNALGFGYSKAAYQDAFPGTFAFNSDIEGRRYDPEKAKQLLTEAGYPNGFKTKIIARGTLWKNVWVAVQGYLSDVGIECEVDLADQARYVDLKFKGWKNALMEVDIGYRPNWILSINHHLADRSSDHSSMLRPAGFDVVIDEALRTGDLKVHTKVGQELGMMIYQDATFAPLFTWYKTGALDRVNDISLNYPDQSRWYPGQAWLSK